MSRRLQALIAEAEEKRLAEGGEVETSDAVHVASLWRAAGNAERGHRAGGHRQRGCR